jgi:flavin-binding protein dodecin
MHRGQSLFFGGSPRTIDRSTEAAAAVCASPRFRTQIADGRACTCGGIVVQPAPVCPRRECVSRPSEVDRPGHLATHAGSQGTIMSNHVYKMLELTGSSTSSIEDAVQGAIAKANESVRNIHWFQVIETRGHVKDGKVAHWQVTIKAGFTLED